MIWRGESFNGGEGTTKFLKFDFTVCKGWKYLIAIIYGMGPFRNEKKKKKKEKTKNGSVLGLDPDLT